MGGSRTLLKSYKSQKQVAAYSIFGNGVLLVTMYFVQNYTSSLTLNIETIKILAF